MTEPKAMAGTSIGGVVALTREEVSALAEIDALTSQLAAKKDGMLQLIYRQRKLCGRWRYEDGKLIEVKDKD